MSNKLKAVFDGVPHMPEAPAPGPVNWQLEQIVDELRAARDDWRKRCGRTRELGSRELPSRQTVAEILAALCGALFPMRLAPATCARRVRISMSDTPSTAR